MSFIKQPGALHTVAEKQPKVISYNGGVINGSGVKGSLFNRPNLVAQYQKIFQAGKEPIHLKTPRDQLVYKGIMYGSFIGILFGMAALSKISLPKKN